MVKDAMESVYTEMPIATRNDVICLCRLGSPQFCNLRDTHGCRVRANNKAITTGSVSGNISVNKLSTRLELLEKGYTIIYE